MNLRGLILTWADHRGPQQAVIDPSSKRFVTIGRGLRHDIHIPKIGVSTTHAALYCEGEAWYIVDLCSTNGTKVWDGDKEVTPIGEKDRRIPVAYGYEIHLGREIQIRVT